MAQLTEEQIKQFTVLLGKFDSALQTIALGIRKMQPYCYKITGGGSPGNLTIPDGVKAFNVINLGLNGLSATFADITVTGVTGISAIPKELDTFAFSIENDQNTIAGPITVTPAASHVIVIQYLL